MKKNLLITYDYELFLGNRSGHVDECLIETTNKSLTVLERYGTKAIFFIDTIYLIQLKKNSSKYSSSKIDYEKIAEQLRHLVANGHYVYPHLHPHWLDAEYLQETNEWRLNNISRYRFHNLTAEERNFVFNESVQLLKEIIHPVLPEYLIDAYRAGGWCIQPFEDFIPLFIANNFKYDMSVLGKFYLFSSVQYFDFSGAPEKNIYRFEDDVTVEKSDGRFVEFNISSIAIDKTTRLLDKIWLKYIYKIKGDHSFTRGQGQIAVNSDMQKPSSLNGHDILSPEKERIAVELLTRIKLPSYFRFMENNNYMHFISHPKMLTNHNHEMFDKFLKKVFSKWEIETDFKKMI